MAYAEDQGTSFLLLGLSVQTLANLTEFNRKMELSTPLNRKKRIVYILKSASNDICFHNSVLLNEWLGQKRW